MANVLFLVHRLPYPPNKGDKVRSFHLLERLASRHRVFLGTFIDDPADRPFIDKVRERCADLHVATITPPTARVRSLVGLLDGSPLTLHYYRDRGMQRWVRQTLADQDIDAVVVFSSSMAQYAEDSGNRPLLIDFIDVDSAKWSQYAEAHRWPMSWLYRREGRRLLAYERHVAARSLRSFFVTEREVGLFTDLAPECVGVAEPMGNGVDGAHFAPDARLASPFAAGELPVVFTGAMDYWPNIDAACWFAAEVLPALRHRYPAVRFHVVGRSPALAVRALACESVAVSGTVPDVRPYLQHAAVVVAPLRLARGIQNKVLEAMAMARPVVASRACVEPVAAVLGEELLAADTVVEFVTAIAGLLDEPGRAAAIGAAGRARILRDYSWAAHLAVLDRHLEARPAAVVPA